MLSADHTNHVSLLTTAMASSVMRLVVVASSANALMLAMAVAHKLELPRSAAHADLVHSGQNLQMPANRALEIFLSALGSLAVHALQVNALLLTTHALSKVHVDGRHGTGLVLQLAQVFGNTAAAALLGAMMRAQLQVRQRGKLLVEAAL